MSDWVDLFKERLSNASSPLPDDELEVLEKMIYKRKLTRNAIWYIGVAASTFILGFYFINSRDNSLQDVNLIPKEGNHTQSPFLADDIPSEENECQEIKPNIIPLFKITDIEETIQDEISQPESTDLKVVPKEKPSLSGNSKNQGHQNLGEYAFEHPEKTPRDKRNWALGLSLRGLSSSFGNQLLDGITNLQSEPIAYRHYSPFSAGILIKYNINRSLFLSSGVDYVYCYSRVSYPNDASHGQTAHYLKIPLLLNTKLYQSRDFSFYAGAGFEASKLLYAKEEGVRLKDKNVYCSATALVGIRYSVTPRVGITLEPFYSYTFLPIERPVLTALTDQPNMFSVKLGLSFSLD